MSKGRDLPEFPQFYNTRIHSSPDGQDCLLKTLHTAKVYGLLGIVLNYHSLSDTAMRGPILNTARCRALPRVNNWSVPVTDILVRE